MIYQGMILRLKPNALAEYKRHHDEFPEKWPQLIEKAREYGIKTLRTFEADPLLFLYAEVEDEDEDEDAFPRLWETEIHKEWSRLMDPLMEMNDEGKPDARFLTRIFDLEI